MPACLLILLGSSLLYLSFSRAHSSHRLNRFLSLLTLSCFLGLRAPIAPLHWDQHQQVLCSRNPSGMRKGHGKKIIIPGETPTAFHLRLHIHRQRVSQLITTNSPLQIPARYFYSAVWSLLGLSFCPARFTG